MTRWLGITLVLFGSIACAGGEDPAAVSSLKVDLGAVVESGAVSPVNGITSAGQPNAEAFKVFAESGYAAVIDIRTEGEDRGLDEPAVVESLGMKYIQLPVGGADITIEKARELDQLLSQYDEPVLVHCGSANRVGALLALSVFDKTGDAELALETGRAGGMTRLEGKVKQVISGE
jgi:uncharacterized protein (TIGR01244 family)